MAAETTSSGESVRAAEIIASLCLATDLGMGFPFEHGLHSTLVAMRLAERLGVDQTTASQTYYACLLTYSGCTADIHPSRTRRIVLMGGGPMVPSDVPGVIKVLASPAGALMVRMSRKPKMVRTMLRKSGHAPSLDSGLIPNVFVDWRAALGRETDSMRHEREMVQAIVRGSAYRPGLTFEDAELERIEQPTLHVIGTADPVGTIDIWKNMAGVLSHGEVRIIDGAGHMPWFEDPAGAAHIIREFLGGE